MCAFPISASFRPTVTAARMEIGGSAARPPIRILLADEKSLFREAVRAVLGAVEDLEVVAEASDGLSAVAEAKRHRPDVAILDAHLPNCDGIRATGMIVDGVPDCRVLVVNGDTDEHVLANLIEAGAMGFVTKEGPLEDLIEATRAVFRDEMRIPPTRLKPLIQSLVSRRREQDEAFRLASTLTRRERQVLALLADGAQNDLIAQRLIISPQTARTHVQNLLSKLGVHSRLEAAAYVTRTGILDELAVAER